jgi:predicted PurR-regulated permease PerM
MKKTIKPKGSTAFFILLIGITIMVLVMIRSYLGVIFFSLILVFILKPLFDRLVTTLRGRRNLAAAMTLLITAVIPVIVFSVAGSLLMEQLRDAAANAASTTDNQAALNSLSSLLESMSASGIQSGTSANPEIVAAIAKLAGAVVSMLASLGFSILNLLLNLIIIITIVAPLLINYDRMMDWLQRFSPFPNEVDLLFVEKIRSMVLAMFLSIFVIALAQSLVMGVFFWIAGTTPIVLWIFLSFLSGTLPFGNAIIAIPLGIYLIANDNLVGGWVLILGYILIVSNMDTIMRPKLIPQNSSLVYVLALLASLGGLALFGYLGVIYGPVIMAVFVTAIEVYLKYYTAPEEIQPA